MASSSVMGQIERKEGARAGESSVKRTVSRERKRKGVGGRQGDWQAWDPSLLAALPPDISWTFLSIAQRSFTLIPFSRSQDLSRPTPDSRAGGDVK